MKELWAHVDREQCFSFGRCVDLAPGVFEWDESGVSVGGRVPDDQREAARKAAESCPRLAITLVETDEGEPHP
jgi:ferredoxin